MLLNTIWGCKVNDIILFFKLLFYLILFIKLYDNYYSQSL